MSDGTQLTFTHIGGPTTLIEIGGWRILTDPTFDPPGRTYRFGWGTSSRKTTGPALGADALGVIDVVLLTHDHHADNLDDAGRALLPAAGSVLTTLAGAARLGGGAQGLRPWATTRLAAPGKPTITVTATPCRHGPPGSHPIVGDVIGFALAWEGQRDGPLWITGDTVLHPALRDAAKRLRPGTVIAHLGRVRFPITGPVKYSMDVDDALELCEVAAPKRIVPVHFDGWSHFSEDRAAIEQRLAADGHPLAERIEWAPPGAPVELAV